MYLDPHIDCSTKIINTESTHEHLSGALHLLFAILLLFVTVAFTINCTFFIVLA